MTILNPHYAAAQQARWLRCDAHCWVKPDAAKFFKPGTDLCDVFPALARQRDRKRRDEDRAFADALDHERAMLDELRRELAEVNAELAQRRAGRAAEAKYSSSQPRVPGGHGRESGRWTSGDHGSGARPRVVIDTTNLGEDATGDAGAGGDSGFDGVDGGFDGADSNPGFDDPGESYDNHDLAYDAPDERVDLGEPVRSTSSQGEPQQREAALAYDSRLASNEEKPQLAPRARIAILAELGRRMVRIFRSENYLFDLFNREKDNNTVSYTRFNERDISGSSSESPTFTNQDRQAANRMRETLIEKCPGIMTVENIGQKPNDALYHAETNVLLRSARENGGTLAGRSIEIYVDRPFCNSCRKVVPLVGLELGNPEITIVDTENILTISDGKITSRRPR